MVRPWPSMDMVMTFSLALNLRQSDPKGKDNVDFPGSEGL